MCTCGIDIATQQLRPAITSTVCSAARDMPSGRDGHVADPLGVAGVTGPVRGERRRSISESGSMVATQNTATPM